MKILVYHNHMKSPILAIILPCYNEEKIINTAYQKLTEILNKLKEKNKISKNSYISIIDDGSTDSSWELIRTFDVKGIKLSRNFGQQKAILAGLCENEADIYISIDADLQDDITVVEEMVEKYHEGYEIVYGVRNNRDNDKLSQKVFANIYYKLNKILGMNTVSQHAEYRLVSKKITDVLKNTNERNIYLRGIITDLGFKSTKVYYKRQKRLGGKSKYNYYKLMKIAIEGITSFSTAPIKLIILLGLLGIFLSIALTLYFLLFKNISMLVILLVSLYFWGSIQLLSVGLIGMYIGKIYKETKKRPIYIIEEKNNI